MVIGEVSKSKEGIMKRGDREIKESEGRIEKRKRIGEIEKPESEMKK